MSDLINHPPHYQPVAGIRGEAIEYTRQMPYSTGCAFKYVWRAGSKDDGLQDISKSIWYLEDAMEHGPTAWTIALIVDAAAPITRRRYLLGVIARGDLARAKQLLEVITDPAQLNEVMP